MVCRSPSLRFLTLSLAAIALLALFPASGHPDASETTAVLQAAKRDLPKFLNAAWKTKADYGFLAGDAMTSVTMGAPVRVYGFDEESRGRMKDGKALPQSVQPVGEWIFPVAVGSEYRTLFGVRPIRGQWKGVYLGNPFLAKSLQEVRKVWGGEKGDRFRLVSSLSPRGFFYTVPERQPSNMTPLTRVALNDGVVLTPPSDWRALRKAEDVIPLLEKHWASDESEPSIPGFGRPGG